MIQNPQTKPQRAKFGGVYSCGGWNGGKIAYLMGVSVTFPNRNGDTKNAWTCDKTRDRALEFPINLGCKQKFIKQGSLNYNSQFTQDKLQVWREFDKLNIPHPKPLSIEDIITSKNNFTFLGRKNNSSRGRGIVKYTRKEWLEKQSDEKAANRPVHDFYVEFLDFKSEHRVHVLNGEIVCELNKVVKEDSTNFIHTSEQGSPLEFGVIEHKNVDLIRKYSIDAISACGLDFGAVDIFIDKDDKIYILEVNSDPGMPGHIGYLYAQRLRLFYGLGPLKDFNLLKNGGVKHTNVRK